MPFYAVAIGRQPGVYDSWDVAKDIVHEYRHAKHQKFSRREDAENFVARYRVKSSDGNESWTAPQAHSVTQSRAPTPQRPPFEPADTSSSSFPFMASWAYNARRPVEQLAPRSSPQFIYFYAVAKGRVPGVYGSWEEAELQVKDLYSAKHKKFLCLKEAHQFVDDYRRSIEADPSDPDPKDPSTLVAFCDGSSVRNGQPGCRAGWACVFPHNSAWDVSGNVSGWRQANNRAEYSAAIVAIVRANREDPARGKPLYIFSDSMLLIRSMTEWVSEWRAAGWVKADGNPVMNVDLLKRLLKEQGHRRIIWKHVTAHTNQTDWKSVWNDRADRMAKEQTSNGSNLKRGSAPAQRGREHKKRRFRDSRMWEYQYRENVSKPEADVNYVNIAMSRAGDIHLRADVQFKM